MERWRPAGPWSGPHFAAEKAPNGTTVARLHGGSERNRSAVFCVPAAAGVPFSLLLVHFLQFFAQLNGQRVVGMQAHEFL